MPNTPLALSTSTGLTEKGRIVGGVNANTFSTGDLRRRYDFGDRFSELALSQTPFFRLVSTMAKKPTDDPTFKFTEKRQSFMKRYAYVVGWKHGSTVKITGAQCAVVKESDDTALSLGGEVKLYMCTDYFSAGNIQNVQGQSNGAIEVGKPGTRPQFFQPNQIVKVPMSNVDGGGAVSDYMLVRITAVDITETLDLSASSGTGVASSEPALITGKVLRMPGSSLELASFSGDKPQCAAYDKDIAELLEGRRSYIVGTSYGEGSSLLGESWKDNPYSTGYGQTQIFRSEFGMTNTARATALKYEPNEWARTWKDKLIEHKWDIEWAGLFSSQVADSSVNHTQGAIDYILNFGNIFTLDLASKSIDDFLQDMSQYFDPRYNQDGATVFLCSTAVYTWLHKLGGFFKNNIAVGDNGNNFNRFQADLAVTGRKKVMGLDVTEIQTVYGKMNVARCIALDGSHVKIAAINMNNVSYRPLVGNGVNRDTSIYVGVQNLENTGVDKRVDMILTEAGFEYKMPESHAIWK
mgnify:FL=1|tara:strand:- start:1758 stop:3323 length:1566 start_codon:yes stop_codon:yes gene_type:complete